MFRKRILITGQGSYIGTSFKKWISQWPEKFEIDEISLRSDDWKLMSFSEYDVILHVAGIAHVSADPKLEDLYFKINRDLALSVAQKAKREMVKQFIFMSSMIIYGSNKINGETIPNPNDFYGRSKLEADLGIQKLNSKDFKTIVVRTPLVYGPKCKGNFPKLIKLAKISPVFPKFNNLRSMIYIDNLCEFLKILITDERYGIFFPQNKEYVCTKDIIDIMAKNLGKKIYFTNIFNPGIRYFSNKINIINKIFGNSIYDQELSVNFEYCVVDFESSIKKSM